MKLAFGNDVEEFRDQFKTWLRANAPTSEEMSADPARGSAHVPAWARDWAVRMFNDGWLVPGWPPERGGRNARPVETLVYLEELARAGVPRTTNPQGLGIIAPSLLDYGTERQIAQFALPILRGERSACLGLSEPGAGSDLASLSTKAVLDGEAFVVTGQKVWTSGAADADFCFLFCRTDPAAPKHKGISVLLVDMATPGVTVRPLPEVVHPESPDLAEVFLDEVVVPRGNLVGRLNDGWSMANGSLAHERGMVWLLAVMDLDAALNRLLEEAPEKLSRLEEIEQAVVADRITNSYVDSLAARALGYRGFAKLARGGCAPEQALMKAFCSESHRRACLAGVELEADKGMEFADPTHRYKLECSWIELYYMSFAGTISAGSSEIQRNIIAEKILGLPRS